MRKTMIAALVALGLGVGLAAVRAETVPEPKTSEPTATKNHDPMMGQMGEMIDRCKNMMQSVNAHPHPVP